jgi:hypothetical protein
MLTYAIIVIIINLVNCDYKRQIKMLFWLFLFNKLMTYILKWRRLFRRMF